LDEIQNIAGWEKWLNRLYEFENIKIFAASSNASILSSEISTALTGRNRQITNYPFSFRELLSLRNYNIIEKDFYIKEKRILLKTLLEEYLILGGFPEVLKIKDETLLEQYFKDILYRDVIARYSIRNAKELRELCIFLASNIGSIYSYKNLQKLIGVKSISTIKNYLEILKECFLFFKLNLFDFSIKRQIYNPSKIFSIDHALNNSIAFKFSEDIGHIYENLVFIELMRKNQEIFYWKSNKGYEVDFVIKKGLKIEKAIQVSYSLTNPKTKEREIRSLIEAQKELKVNNLLILTKNEEKQEKIGNIKIIILPLWKWLLI
ncbi:MAG: ATP-binding protein, partial [Armatimonadetes bacterium]|nr:ATP-binding protein [Armatimonadota bacterium]